MDLYGIGTGVLPSYSLFKSGSVEGVPEALTKVNPKLEEG